MPLPLRCKVEGMGFVPFFIAVGQLGVPAAMLQTECGVFASWVLTA